LGGSRTALAVVRSLAREGVQSWVVLTDEHRVATCSRYTSRSLRLTAWRDLRAGELLHLASAYGLEGWVVIPTDDDHVRLLADNHEALAAVFHLGVPPASALAWATDKRATQALAEGHGLDHPRTWPLRDETSLESPDITFPAIIKPAYRPAQVANSMPKAWRADSPQQLQTVYGAARAVMGDDPLMLQELIPGGGRHQLSLAAVCSRGQILASVAARRMRQWPIEFGMSSTYVETIPAGELAEPAQRLLSATGFTGIVELEFKRDPRDGRLALLDVNPRAWGWISLAERAGVNFPHLLYRLLLGQDVPRCHGLPGMRWRRVAADIPACLALARAGKLGAADYLRGLRPPVAGAVLSADDPLPALADPPLLAAIALRRGLARRRSSTSRRYRTAAQQGAHISCDAGRRPRALIMLENSSVPGDARVWNESLALRQGGWDVTVLAPHAWEEPPRPDVELTEQVEVHRFPLRPAEASRLGYLGEYGTAMWRIWRAVRSLTRVRPFDVIHASNPPDFLLLAVIGQRRRGTRLVFDHHDLAPEMYATRPQASRLVWRVLVLLERLAFSLADVALATNESVRRVAVVRGAMPAEDVFVVRNGPPLNRFTPVAADRKLARGRPHLLVYVGMMGPQDGVDHALHALAHLRR
jgi:predicted ATP-grasp superfamily ATP-dependent carboligase